MLFHMASWRLESIVLSRQGFIEVRYMFEIISHVMRACMFQKQTCHFSEVFIVVPRHNICHVVVPLLVDLIDYD